MTIPAENLASHYLPTQAYAHQRQLEPQRPHFDIPPPEVKWDRSGNSSFEPEGQPFRANSSQYGNPDFLNALGSVYPLQMAHSMYSWQYEMRRDAHNITPFLFLGPSSMAKNVSFIKDNGITLLVAARSSKLAQARASFLDPSKFASSAGIETLAFDFEDTAEFISRAKPAIRAINDHLGSTCARTPIETQQDMQGKVLIFCESGNGRSALLCAAYLLVVYGLNAVTAIQAVQCQRFCIVLGDDMKNVLLDLQHIFEAERQVWGAKNAAAQLFIHPADGRDNGAPRPAKRGADDLYASDEEIAADVERKIDLKAREGVAPFKDIGPG
jgi:serine/threonine/tyrosine-interacting protein